MVPFLLGVDRLITSGTTLDFDPSVEAFVPAPTTLSVVLCETAMVF